MFNESKAFNISEYSLLSSSDKKSVTSGAASIIGLSSVTLQSKYNLRAFLYSSRELNDPKKFTFKIGSIPKAFFTWL